MGTLSELLAERRALDAQIEEAKTAIARSGESVVIDGETIDSTVNVEGELANPKDDAFLFTYEKAENGDIKNVGELTYKQLVDRFAQEATTILNQAIAAGETSVENIQEALTAALAAIGQDNASGARGQAIAAINALYSTIAEAITSANSAWNSQVSTDKSAWASQVTSDLQSLATALSNALAAIGESNSAGARGAAIDAVNEALQNALASIGQSDTAGARGNAITAITTALNNALASIGQSDSEGARKAALDSINAKTTEVNTALDQKISGANTTIDQKVQTATEKAAEAESSASAAALSETNAKASETAAKTSETNAKTSETNAKSSETASASSEAAAKASEEAAAASESAALASKNAAAASEQNAKASETNASGSASTASAKAAEATASAEAAAQSAKDAEAAANVPMADETTAGRMKMYSTTGQNTDGTIHQKGITDAIEAAKSDLNAAIQNISGSVSSEASTRASADSTLQTNIDNEANARSSADSTLQGNIDSEASARESADSSLSSRISALEGKGSGLPVGAVFWWFGTTSNKPSNTLVCDGSSFSSSSYPELYQKLGKTTLPNITGSKRFIRGSTTAGTTQSDAIRNITGYIETARLGANISSAFYSSGCFSASAGSNSGADKNDSWQTYRISFNASNVVTTSTEVRPTNISAIPLIVAI